MSYVHVASTNTIRRKRKRTPDTFEAEMPSFAVGGLVQWTLEGQLSPWLSCGSGRSAVGLINISTYI